MRKIRDVLRLYFAAALSIRAIARSLGTSPSTVGEYLRRAKVAGLSWPVPESVDDTGLERRLFPPPPPSRTARPLPDWSEVHRELRRKSVTLSLLWQEYKETHPEGLQYSWFCEQYRAWAAKLDLVMRQEHRAGEKLFVDYAGQTVPVVDRKTGAVRQAQIFVAVLGASSYTFAEATWTQTLPDWTASHVRAFAFYGGCPELVVPDNLRSGVSRAHRYEPDLNPTYHDLARHYGVAVLPARVRRPRDKAKAEVAVQVVERWILAALRHRTFFSLAELNAAIAELLERLNTRRFRKLPGSRRSQFEELDRPALRPLPNSPYVFAEWQAARASTDYHVEVDGHYYSVPHALVRRQLDVRLTARTVECFHRGQRVASHVRSPIEGATPPRPSTCPRSTAGWATGHPTVSSTGPRRSDRTPPRSSPPSSPGVIPSKPTAPASGFSAWPSAMATPAWKRPPPAPSPSTAAATAASSRSSVTGSTRPRPSRQNPPSPSTTTTSAAPSTTSDA